LTAQPPSGLNAGAPLLRIEAVSKRFDGVAALQQVSLELQAGEFFALLGPSGCGKTTLLRAIAGFETPDAGAILLEGADLAGVPPYRRPVNMVFQAYALFPHLSVAGNIAFGLRQEGLPKSEIEDRVAAMLVLVELGNEARRKPDQLSGGQRQRVALARALVKQPKLLLLDEPLAALDRRLRERTRSELVALQRRLGISFLMVTHDQEEAMTLASRIAVMEQGRIAQVGTPQEIYERPASRYVAEFIGEANILGTDLLLRPEEIDIDHAAPPDGTRQCVAGEVTEVGYQGSQSLYRVRIADGKLLTVLRANRAGAMHAPIRLGDRVHLSWPEGAGTVLRG
jgi:putrescine transport system ATP-binding protein